LIFSVSVCILDGDSFNWHKLMEDLISVIVHLSDKSGMSRSVALG